MNHFNIKDIENLCGIKAHTLRIWEKRHQLVLPKRKQSKHRFYDNDDLKELLRISFLYHQGYKISEIACLSSREIDAEVESTPLCEKNHEIFVHQLIEAGLDFDKERFEKMVNSLVLCIGLEKCIGSVFYPLLRRIGLLWMTNNAIPAQEHFVSHIIRKKIICATDALEMDEQQPADIIVFAPTGEFHEIPILVANYFFRKYHKQTVYFGINIPVDCLRYYARHHPVRVLFMHAITNLGNPALDLYMKSLCRHFEDKEIILSGPACTCVEDKHSGLRRVCSLEDMRSFAMLPIA
jgi:DNA-binding transcriptional MerR regulator